MTDSQKVKKIVDSLEASSADLERFKGLLQEVEKAKMEVFRTEQSISQEASKLAKLSKRIEENVLKVSPEISNIKETQAAINAELQKVRHIIQSQLIHKKDLEDFLKPVIVEQSTIKSEIGKLQKTLSLTYKLFWGIATIVLISSIYIVAI